MRDDGGLAFPGKRLEDLGDGIWVDMPYPGMTLRDWFAGQALASMLLNATGLAPESPATVEALEGVAMVSYIAADAMLAARKVDQS